MKHKITPAKIKAIAKHIEKWKHELFLTGWKYKLEFQNADKENATVVCEIDTNENYFDALIYVYPRYFTLSKEEQEETIVHELSHSHTAEVLSLLRKLMAGYLVTDCQAIEAVERLTQTMCNIAMRKK
jgi:hypothetical protein